MYKQLAHLAKLEPLLILEKDLLIVFKMLFMTS